MGRSYWYECSKCSYRANVSGRADRGVHAQVQTITCRDCRQLFDAVVQLKIPHTLGGLGMNSDGLLPSLRNTRVSPRPAPSFMAAINRLAYQNAPRYRWETFRLQCPVNPSHRIRVWNEPDACPKCGVLLEKSSRPYRLWD